MLGRSSMVRTELVTPAMCGHNSLFVGQLGDWTWDAVSAACGINAYQAAAADGSPTYLSFYYFRVSASRRMHPLAITFGDRLQVVSGVFGYGSESVLTLHRIRREDGTPPRPVEPDEFYRHADEDCLYVENFNRWISRTRPGSNRDLTRASPAGFEHRHLPRLPERYSPRLAYARARDNGTFRPPGSGPPAGRLDTDYPVEVSRDLNGVGLLYFASYFSIVDWALVRLWRQAGRGDAAFLSRVVLDHQLCYLGNADADAVIAVTASRWPAGPGGPELADVVLRDRASGAVLAVSTQRLQSPAVAQEAAR
jgi:probable biosynthetic protein (TIGR04098 family)